MPLRRSGRRVPNTDSGSWVLGRAATTPRARRARLPEIRPRRRTGASTVSVTTGETTGRMRRLPGFDRPIRSRAPAAFASFVKAGRFYGRSAVLRTRQRLQSSRSKTLEHVSRRRAAFCAARVARNGSQPSCLETAAQRPSAPASARPALQSSRKQRPAPRARHKTKTKNTAA